MFRTSQPSPTPIESITDANASSFFAPCDLAEDGADSAKARACQPILDSLLRNAPLHGAIQDKLGKAITAAVAWPGRLLRYQLALGTARTFGASEVAAESLACATEYFHIASLLLDDLPSMDDSMERRGRICLHLLYGDDMVILCALALITRAYALQGSVVSSAPAERQLRAHALIDRCLGTSGILNGQARDLNFRTGQGRHREATAIALQKTVPLIGLALMAPALLFGASPPALLLLRRLSVYWGLFYQGVDDFKDLVESSTESGKTSAQDEKLGRPNIALQSGRENAARYVHRLCGLAQGCLAELTGRHPQLGFLTVFQCELQMHWQALGANLSLKEEASE